MMRQYVARICNKKSSVRFSLAAIVLGIMVCGCSTAEKNQAQEMKLRQGWKIQPSSLVEGQGETVSTEKYDDQAWIEAYVPSTIMGILAAKPENNDILLADNYYGFDKSIFNEPWWYRTSFELNDLDKSQSILLKFDGISYKANIWLNGVKIADQNEALGTFNRFSYDISKLARKGKNYLAVEVYRQREGDFGLGFVDWNPRPLDENMGLWRDVSVLVINQVQVKNSFVRSKVNLQTLDEAWLTVGTELKNFSDKEINGTLLIRFEEKELKVPITLKAGEEKQVLVSADELEGLHIEQARLWWSSGLGEPNLYQMSLGFEYEGTVLHGEDFQFGIREIETYLNETGQRGYKLNGTEILIKGAGWTDEIFLRDTPESNETQVRYVKDMGMNTIRFETIWGTDKNIYELCDRYGILAMVGWSCQWEWENYLGKACDEFGGITTADDMALVLSYTEHQVKWLRNHPSIFVWLMGSDMLPRPELEKQYISLFNEIDNRPWLGAASWRESELTGPTGVKMHGPYEYVGPSYWYVDKKFGGAYGFNTETGPGPQLPVKESIMRMIDQEKRWPLSKAWDNYCTTSSTDMNSMALLNTIVSEMWGAPSGFDDFVIKSHMVNYEAIRAMLEAFRANRPQSTGIIQWMLNSAWPSLYWQLYDYWLVPTPAYYASKKALAPLQLIYHYGNHSIVASNELLSSFENGKALITVYSSGSEQLWEKTVQLTLPANGAMPLLSLPKFKQPVLLSLRLYNAQNAEVSNNFYWLSDQNEEYIWDRTNWVHTPMKKYYNYKELNDLDKAEVQFKYESVNAQNGQLVSVHIENLSDKIALFNQLKISDKQGNWIVPAFYSDNYFALMPFEKKTITVELATPDPFDIELSGWNMATSN